MLFWNGSSRGTSRDVVLDDFIGSSEFQATHAPVRFPETHAGGLLETPLPIAGARLRRGRGV